MVIQEWWDGLSSAGQIYGGLAVFFTVAFFFQMVISLMGGEHDHAHDGGAGHDGHDGDISDSDSDHHVTFWHFFTVRNIIAFFLGFSWGGLAVLDNGKGVILSVIGGSAIGVVFVFFNLMLLRILGQLQSSGNLNINYVVGARAEVVVGIPAHTSGSGKITLSVQGRMVDIEAVTHGEEIPSRSTVVVQGLSGHQVVVARS